MISVQVTTVIVVNTVYYTTIIYTIHTIIYNIVIISIIAVLAERMTFHISSLNLSLL